jgi:hypothetical protein
MWRTATRKRKQNAESSTRPNQGGTIAGMMDATANHCLSIVLYRPTLDSSKPSISYLKRSYGDHALEAHFFSVPFEVTRD